MDSKVSEKDMREVYFQAFGKEYDSADRKQAPLPLEIAYLTALNKLKREGKYAEGGEITDDAYYQSVNHFVYFCLNYPNNFLDAFDGNLKNHLSNKFKDYYNKYGTFGAMMMFYAELDAENRILFTNWVLKNYKGNPISSDISKKEYHNVVNHFFYFAMNYPSNFLDAFSSYLKPHLSEKWVSAYEKKGTMGAMIQFWSELDTQNRKDFSIWIKNNYTGTPLYEMGGGLGDVAGMLPSPLPMSTIQPMAKGGGISADKFVNQVKSMHENIEEVILKDGTHIAGKDLMANGGSIKVISSNSKTRGSLVKGTNFENGLFIWINKLNNTYKEEYKYGVYNASNNEKIVLFKTLEDAETFYNQSIKTLEKESPISRQYSDGGGIKSDYYIFEGVDNLNGNPLYRVESTSESDNEYVGEWHTDKSDAQKELDELSKSKDEYALGGFLLGAGVGIAGSYLYNNAKVEKDKDGVKVQIKKPKKVFKYGGEIEERVKEKLSRNFALPFEVVVYVPSTQDADKTVSKEEFIDRITEVETYLAKIFGGFSANPVDGGYNSDEKGLITEDVFKVYSFASRDGFEPKMEKLVIQIKDWCKTWGQEAIGLEFEGDLFYVEA